jgi:pilus assembly protein CpaC
MSTRCWGTFAAWLCVVGLSFGAESPALRPPQPFPQTELGKSDPLSATEHLRAAAEQMEAAGLREEAANLRAASERLNQRAQQEITALEQHVTTLQQKSQQLQQLIGRPTRVVCRCRLLELPTKAAAEFDTAVERVWGSAIGPRETAPGISVCRNAEEVLQRLRDAGKVTVVAESQVVTLLGQSATAETGGEFPILTAAGGDVPAVRHPWFGFRCAVLPQFLDARRIRLDVRPEIVERDYDHSVQSNGLVVPGLTTVRVCGKVEMNLGQTVVVRFGPTETTELEDAADLGLETVLCRLIAKSVTPATGRTVRVVTVTPLAASSTSN